VTLAWQQLTTTNTPTARIAHSAAVHPGYSTGGGLLIFGGVPNEDGGSTVQGTRILDLTSLTWSTISDTGAPPARQLAAMAYHAASDKLVLFGGTDRTGSSHYGDTWTWDPTNGWVQQSPVHSPSSRYGTSLAPDANGHLVLFGGFTGSRLSDTWTWDGTDWTVQSPATSPPGTSSQTAGYDSSNSTHYIFGGATASGYTNATWAWDGTTWTSVSTVASPDPRIYHALGFDPAYGQIVTFAGYDYETGDDVNDVWALNPASPTWNPATPGSSPGSRENYGAALCYSATLGGLIFFGGWGRSGDINYNDTWLLSVPAPPAVTGVSPGGGAWATSVTITGTAFTGATAVKFGTTTAAFTVNSSTSITAIAPPGVTGTVDITVTTPNGTSATSVADQFTYSGQTPALALPNFQEASLVTFAVPEMVNGGSTSLPSGSQSYSSVWSPDGTKLWIGDMSNGHLYVLSYIGGAYTLVEDLTIGSTVVIPVSTKDGSKIWATERGTNKLYSIDTTTYAISAGIGGFSHDVYYLVLSDDATTAYVIDSNYTSAGTIQVVSLPSGTFGTPITCMSHPDPGKIARVPGTTKIIVTSYQENVFDLIDAATPGGTLLHSWAPGQGGGSGDPGSAAVSPDGTMAFLGISDGSTGSGGIIVDLLTYSTIVTVAGYPNNYHGNIWAAWSADGNWVYASTTSASGSGPSYALKINASTGAVTPASYGDNYAGSYGGSLQPYQDPTSSASTYNGVSVMSHGTKSSGPIMGWAQTAFGKPS